MPQSAVNCTSQKGNATVVAGLVRGMPATSAFRHSSLHTLSVSLSEPHNTHCHSSYTAPGLARCDVHLLPTARPPEQENVPLERPSDQSSTLASPCHVTRNFQKNQKTGKDKMRAAGPNLLDPHCHPAAGVAPCDTYFLQHTTSVGETGIFKTLDKE